MIIDDTTKTKQERIMISIQQQSCFREEVGVDGWVNKTPDSGKPEKLFVSRFQLRVSHFQTASQDCLSETPTSIISKPQTHGCVCRHDDEWHLAFRK